MFWPCETRTSTCRNLATISSGLYRFLAITVLLDVKDIPQVGPLQWGRISMTFWARLSIYAGVVVLYVGTAAWIVRAWIRKRYRDKSPSDLHYIAVGIVLVVSAGL